MVKVMAKIIYHLLSGEFEIDENDEELVFPLITDEIKFKGKTMMVFDTNVHFLFKKDEKLSKEEGRPVLTCDKVTILKE